MSHSGEDYVSGSDDDNGGFYNIGESDGGDGLVDLDEDSVEEQVGQKRSLENSNDSLKSKKMRTNLESKSLALSL